MKTNLDLLANIEKRSVVVTKKFQYLMGSLYEEHAELMDPLRKNPKDFTTIKESYDLKLRLGLIQSVMWDLNDLFSSSWSNLYNWVEHNEG